MVRSNGKKKTNDQIKSKETQNTKQTNMRRNNVVEWERWCHRGQKAKKEPVEGGGGGMKLTTTTEKIKRTRCCVLTVQTVFVSWRLSNEARGLYSISQ